MPLLNSSSIPLLLRIKVICILLTFLVTFPYPFNDLGVITASMWTHCAVRSLVVFVLVFFYFVFYFWVLFMINREQRPHI